MLIGLRGVKTGYKVKVMGFTFLKCSNLTTTLSSLISSGKKASSLTGSIKVIVCG
jgi:hypothetical protein